MPCCTKRVRRDLVVEIFRSFEPAVKELFQGEKELDSDGIKTQQARRNCSGITEITRGIKGVEQGGRGFQIRRSTKSRKIHLSSEIFINERENVGLDDTIYTHRYAPEQK